MRLYFLLNRQILIILTFLRDVTYLLLYFCYILLLYLILVYIKSKRLRWADNVARRDEGRSAFKILTEKRPSGSPRRTWEDNIRIYLK